MGFFIRLIVTAVALWLATVIVDGITVSGKGWVANTLTLIVVAFIFGLVNAFLKPIIKIVGCIFYILTLGLIALVVNALLFLFVSWIADKLHLPFHVDGFWSAFWGAIIVGVISWAANMAFGRDRTPTSTPTPTPERPTY